MAGDTVKSEVCKGIGYHLFRGPVPGIFGIGNIVSGAFTPVLAKHSKSFSLLDSISVGVDRMQRNFEPMRRQVETWRNAELTTVAAKMIIYEAFIESELEVPKHLARTVHDHYFIKKTPAEEFTCKHRSMRVFS